MKKPTPDNYNSKDSYPNKPIFPLFNVPPTNRNQTPYEPDRRDSIFSGEAPQISHMTCSGNVRNVMVIDP